MSVALPPRAVPFILLWTSLGAITRVAIMWASVGMGWSIPWDILDAAGQTLVLATVVSWGWWWAPATLAGGAVRELGIGWFYQPLTSWILLPALGVMAAFPQWLVLRRYGLRAAAWLAVPVVVSPITRALYAALGPSRSGGAYLEYYGSIGNWLPVTATSGAITAGIEAMALVWILAPEFASAPQPRATAPRPVPRRLAAPLHIGSVQTCLGVLIALAIPIFMPTVMMEKSALPDPQVLPFAVAAILPWVIALGLLTRPRLQHAGLALTATASIIALIPLLPFMALVTLLSGFMLDNKDQWLTYSGAVVATVTLVIVAVQAIRAVRSMPDAARFHWSWPSALVGCLAYAMIVATKIF
jgi:hypothetical protein